MATATALLEYLCTALNAQYISDLQFAAQRGSPLLRQTIERAPYGQFSAHAWLEAGRYLLGDRPLFPADADEETLRRRLLEALQKD